MPFEGAILRAAAGIKFSPFLRKRSIKLAFSRFYGLPHDISFFIRAVIGPPLLRAY
jgi:hypothetical protein